MFHFYKRVVNNCKTFRNYNMKKLLSKELLNELMIISPKFKLQYKFNLFKKEITEDNINENNSDNEDLYDNNIFIQYLEVINDLMLSEIDIWEKNYICLIDN